MIFFTIPPSRLRRATSLYTREARATAYFRQYCRGWRPLRLNCGCFVIYSAGFWLKHLPNNPQSLRDSSFQKEPKIISNRGKANLRGRSIKNTELSAIVASLEKEVARHSRDGGLIYQTTNCLTAHLIRLASSTPSPQGEGEFNFGLHSSSEGGFGCCQRCDFKRTNAVRP